MSERRKKSETGSPKSEEGVKAERLKAKGALKSEVGSPKSEAGSRKSEEENTSTIDTPHSKLTNPATHNIQPTTQKMEVHHHPEVEKKTFKEYILEGLMIFLAVVMGFIAENIRESITEHKRAAEFAQSYYGDIKKDTSQINKAIRLSNHKMAAIDSAVNAIRQPSTLYGDTVIAYKAIIASAVLPFEPSSGNLESIKTSGAVRNFKQKMISLMNEYDLQARGVIRRDEINQKFITEQFIPYGLTAVNFETSYDIMTTGKISHQLVFPGDAKERQVFINILVVDKIFILRSMQEYKKLHTAADKVLTELKKEYNLEDE
jgi:hypothetical protein